MPFPNSNTQGELQNNDTQGHNFVDLHLHGAISKFKRIIHIAAVGAVASDLSGIVVIRIKLNPPLFVKIYWGEQDGDDDGSNACVQSSNVYQNVFVLVSCSPYSIPRILRWDEV